MKLETIQRRIRRVSGVRMPSVVTDDDITDLANEAYLHLVALTSWEFRTTSTAKDLEAGQGTFTIPDDLVEVESVAVRRPRRWRGALNRRMLVDLDRYPEHERSRGRPFAWGLEAERTIEVVPAPAEKVELQLRGIAKVDELADPDDEPIFAAEYHPIIVYEAARRLLIEEGDDSGRAGSLRGTVASLLLSMARRYAPVDPEGPVAAYLIEVEAEDEQDERHQPAVPPQEVQSA